MNIYYSLAFLCTGKAVNVLRQSPDGHGAETYRFLLHRLDRRDIQSASGLLQMILGFSMGSDLAQVKDKLAEFGALVGRYNAQSLDELPDGIHKAVIIKGSPEPLKTHLQVNHQENHTVNDIQGMVEGFVDAKLGWRMASMSSNDPMEVDAVQKGTGRGAKGKGKGKAVAQDACKYCGKKGHWAKDCWKKQSDEAKGKGKDKNKGKSKGKSKKTVYEVSEEQSQQMTAGTGSTTTSQRNKEVQAVFSRYVMMLILPLSR